MEKQKVRVTGYVERKKVLKVVRRTGRKAEYWPFPYNTEYYPYASEYLNESTFTSSYNYYMHGHNESVHGYFPDQPYSTLHDQTVSLFSDDNVHAYCTIMWSISNNASFIYKWFYCYLYFPFKRKFMWEVRTCCGSNNIVDL